DGHGDPYLQGDVQIRRGGTIMEYIEVKVADPNRKKGPITIAEMDGKGWREHRRILMVRHCPGNGDWLCSMWATTWDDLLKRAHGPEPYFWFMHTALTRGVTLHEIADRIRAEGGMAVWWGAAFYMTIDKLCEMLEAAYGEEAT
ncbi:unnamed protein product, partial [marine sediment metagenome]